ATTQPTPQCGFGWVGASYDAALILSKLRVIRSRSPAPPAVGRVSGHHLAAAGRPCREPAAADRASCPGFRPAVGQASDLDSAGDYSPSTSLVAVNALKLTTQSTSYNHEKNIFVSQSSEEAHWPQQRARN